MKNLLCLLTLASTIPTTIKSVDSPLAKKAVGEKPDRPSALVEEID